MLPLLLAATLTLQHHEILPSQLAAPHATPSVDNGPIVVTKPAGAQLLLPSGYAITQFAAGLSGPRYMAQAPNGDVFVTETFAHRITVLRDADQNGVAEESYAFARGLNEPFGIAFHDGSLYVGDSDAVLRYSYTTDQTAAKGTPVTIATLPSGGSHSLRNLVFDASGAKLYVGVGSTGNNSPESDPRRAAILQMNPDGSEQRIFATGLRNPSGLAIEPVTGALWTTVNERDGLGDDLVPDYATSVADGAFFGWPYSYIGKNADPSLGNQRPDLVATAVVPDVLLQAHSAALGLTFWRGDAYVAMHGSWNRSRRTGYKVVRIPMKSGRPAGGYDDFIIGWSPDEASRNVWGRPVGLLVLNDGSLLISDDGANVIWRVTYTPPPRRRAAH